MRAITETQVEHEVVMFLTSQPSPEAIIAFRLSAEMADRFYELIDFERERALTDEEQSELDVYLYLNHLLIMMKVEAHRFLGHTASQP